MPHIFDPGQRRLREVEDPGPVGIGVQGVSAAIVATAVERHAARAVPDKSVIRSAAEEVLDAEDARVVHIHRACRGQLQDITAAAAIDVRRYAPVPQERVCRTAADPLVNAGIFAVVHVHRHAGSGRAERHNIGVRTALDRRQAGKTRTVEDIRDRTRPVVPHIFDPGQRRLREVERATTCSKQCICFAAAINCSNVSDPIPKKTIIPGRAPYRIRAGVAYDKLTKIEHANIRKGTAKVDSVHASDAVKHPSLIRCCTVLRTGDPIIICKQEHIRSRVTPDHRLRIIPAMISCSTCIRIIPLEINIAKI